MKILAILLATMFLSGCALFGEPKVKLRTETVEVFKPILYCPAPDYDQLQPPSLAIEEITQETTDGEVALRYEATVEQLKTHIQLLLKQFEKYDSANEAYKELEQEFLKQLEKGDFDINTDKPQPAE